MVHELIVTSAKQGLEGGSGDQAVLRSAGMPPQVASRLKAAGGYSHPFPHGDARNPVVYVHRIEEAAGKTWHVLGCIRDVGSDHTGRSNFLAHMLAANQADVRGKKGGPAAVMSVAGLFKDSWSGPPNDAPLPKTLVAGDEKPKPGSCKAWTDAGLDAGLAGDLAANAAAGKPVVLVTRPGDDVQTPRGDFVLKLFCDALRLVPPEKRWSVTFNTCAIESFNGIWTAIRDDLPQARGLRDSRAAVVIDLTKTPRGSDDPYARFARGEAKTLPWQAEDPQEKDVETLDGEASQGGIPSGPAPRRGAGTIKAPSHVTKNGGRSGGGLETDRRTLPGGWEEESPGRSWVRPLLAVTACLLFVSGLGAFVYRDEIGAILSPAPVDRKPDQVKDVPAEPPGPTPEDLARREEELRQAAIAVARKTLEAAGGRPREAIRAAAAALIAEIDRLRQGTKDEPALAIRLPDGTEPKDIAVRAKDAVDRADELLQWSDASPSFMAELEAATKELNEAVGLLDAAEKQVPQIAAAERKARSDAMSQQQVAEAAKRQRDAFADFSKALLPTTELPIFNDADLPGGTRSNTKPNQVDLGPFAVADLVEPSLRLAVPKETIDGQPFEPVIEDLGSDRWEVQYSTGLPGFDEDRPPQPIASLTVRDGRLVLEVDRKQLQQPAASLLRRCVILVEAKDPETKQPSVREIRLVQPKKVGPIKLNLTGGKQAIKIPSPAGIFRRDAPSGGTETGLTLPVSGIEVKGQWGGQQISVRLPEQATDPTQPGIGTWKDVPLAELAPGVELVMTVTLSLPQATLACTPKLAGAAAKTFDLKQIEAFRKIAKTLPKVNQKFFDRVANCPIRKFGKSVPETTVNQWFEPLSDNLATKMQMELELQGHGTVAKSIDAYFKAAYGAKDEQLKGEYERELIAAKDEEAKKKVVRKYPPKPDFFESYGDWRKYWREPRNEPEWNRAFVKHLDAWADWFWQTFEPYWKTQEQIANAALNQVTEVRLLAITSVARDAAGREYLVPLVEFHPDGPVQLAPFADSPKASTAARDKFGPAPPPDDGEPIGID